ncbi:MAG TPA: TIGR04282 family arsenosugar biosynthesis glycosyltransferase [Micromonosporaceae bacterium]|nr:TIGR04282 family arsenosugar biosynthesis glycosyltransferase [Micromonosporaceae bacterium]
MRCLAASILVIAKAPGAGRSKTRLCPPLTPAEAADVARASLADTLCAVCRVPVRRRVLVLDGDPAGIVPPGVDLVPQAGGGLDERLAAAFDEVGGPGLLIGMDTPQVTPALLESAVALLLGPGVDAVLGLAEDGGWWAIGLRTPDPALFLGVPMSTPVTGARQRARLDQYGLRTCELPVLRDVDTIEDAYAVARLVPGSRFAAALRAARPAQE